MKQIEGDLVKLGRAGAFDVIVHGCNCFNTMGAGIAKSLRRAFPEAYESDLRTVKGSREKLGTITWANCSLERLGEHESSGKTDRGGETSPNRRLIVVNAYTQYRYGGRGVLVDYDAVRSCFALLRDRFKHLECDQSDGGEGKQTKLARIGYPAIGAGLARGDWARIQSIIDEELHGCDHTLVKYVKEPLRMTETKKRASLSKKDRTTETTNILSHQQAILRTTSQSIPQRPTKLVTTVNQLKEVLTKELAKRPKDANKLNEKDVAKRLSENSDRILDVLRQLDQLPVTTSVLEQTLVGALITKLKNFSDPTVAAEAKQLVKKWRRVMEGNSSLMHGTMKRNQFPDSTQGGFLEKR